ncbi:MAG: hypothetical protein NVV73_03050 [Cellvibrionaceae bacterium]|nr:hypothetical protein [Cellvibrionaceae bacterium]
MCRFIALLQEPPEKPAAPPLSCNPFTVLLAKQENMQMKKTIFKQMISRGRKIGATLIVAGALASLPQITVSQMMSDYSVLPPLSVQTQSQQSIMLAMSLDHQVYMKAYNDFSDLTGDGIPDNTYLPQHNYVGYFDPTLCYESDRYTGLAQPYFIPAERRDPVSLRCASGYWSGNFLNWVTMTRIDLVRQVLYGGYRYIDDPNLTVLERSYLPSDAHSFAKYVPAGVELDGLAVVPASNSECQSNPADPKCLGYTFCNTTKPPAHGILSQRVAEPPLLRVVKGNYMLWDASERYQCLTTSKHYPNRYEFSNDGAGGNADLKRVTYEIGRDSEAKPVLGEVSDNRSMLRDPSGANLNDPAKSGIHAFSLSPLRENVHDYIVRVSVCDPDHQPAVIGTFEGKDIYSFECQTYENNNSKPIGLLQRYGTGASQYNVQFGLLSRGYDSNKGYGALRKNLGSFIDEINVDGTFKSLQERPNSIVHNLNAMRVVDYLYQRGATSEWYSGGNGGHNEYSGTYRPGAAPDEVGCEWGRSSFTPGTCRNWGNPFSQILAESFRYLTGAARANVATESRIRDGISVDTWRPLPANPSGREDQFSCSAKGVLGFNASSVSYDWSSSFRSATPNSLGIPGAPASSPSLATLTNELGREAGIRGSYFVGATNENADGFCTVKSVNNLGEVTGTCPETPRLEGVI